MAEVAQYSSLEVEAPVEGEGKNKMEIHPEPSADVKPDIDDLEANKDSGKKKGTVTSWLEFFGFKYVEKSQEDLNAPQLPFWELFILFLWFGCRAFGGPVAQIALMKQELVTEKKWISNERFMRVYSVYQILPGPEATELACYFGLLAGGRIGAFLGGLGFLLPGFLGMA